MALARISYLPEGGPTAGFGREMPSFMTPSRRKELLAKKHSAREGGAAKPAKSKAFSKWGRERITAPTQRPYPPGGADQESSMRFLMNLFKNIRPSGGGRRYLF